MISRLTTKALSAILIATLLFSAAAPLWQPSVVHAAQIPAGTLGKDLSFLQVQELLGGSTISADNWRGVGSDSNPQSLGVTVTGPKGDITFLLRETSTIKRDSGGKDSYDYIFLPVVDGKVVDGGMKLVYRVTPGTSIGGGEQRSAAIIGNETGNGYKITDRIIAQLEGFTESDIAGFLAGKSGDNLDSWAKNAGLKTSEQASKLGNYLDSNKDDPFALAVKKLAEIVSDLNQSVVGALKWAVNAANFSDITPLVEGWKIVRDLVNLLFVLILLTIALMTILRLDSNRYSVRALLPMLIFAIVAVNFSFLLATILVNVAYIAGQPFLSKAAALIDLQPAFVDGSSLGQAVVLLIAQLITLVALILLLIFFIVRIVVIWLVGVLSPVIFITMVLPLMRGEARKLLLTFIRWVFMAPAAFFILFLGYGMLSTWTTQMKTGDAGTDSILQAIFYAAVIITAVAIPLSLGGKLLGTTLKHSQRAGRVAGKGGLGLSGSIPLGHGWTVGEARRTGGAFLEQRKSGQKQRAEERAAALSTSINQGLGGSGLSASITGLDNTQALGFLERQVDHQLKTMEATGIDDAAMRRIVGYNMGTVPGSQLSKLEHGYAETRIGEYAAVKALSQRGWYDDAMLARYAHLGYQTNMAGLDPLIGNVKRTYRGGPLTADDVNRTDLGIQMREMDSEGAKKVMAHVWESAQVGSDLQRQHPGAWQVWRDALGEGVQDESGTRHRINQIALRSIMDPSHRNAATQRKRQAVGNVFNTFNEQAREAIIEGNLMPGTQGRDWVNLNGGPSREQARRNHREGERDRHGM
jgi:hypothetical protein